MNKNTFSDLMIEYQKRQLKIMKDEIVLENAIRSKIRKLIKEENYGKTGLNILRSLLKKILPIIEEEFKLLTTSKEQRTAFVKHLIASYKNTLEPIQLIDANEQSELFTEDIDVEVNSEEDGNEDVDLSALEDIDKFIDINDDGVENDSDEEVEQEDLEGSPDEITGRNVALQVSDKTSNQLVNHYELLQNSEDRNAFTDYFFANLKLYAEKWEDELGNDPDDEVKEPESLEVEEAPETAPEEVEVEPEPEEEEPIENPFQ